ncbi:MAG TPA: DUF4910 domain-containing protein [Magnetovibrio sp.]
MTKAPPPFSDAFNAIAQQMGADAYALADRLFPIPRSLTGNGVRQSLEILKELIPDLQVHEIASGTNVLDWVIPDEWNIREAYIEDLNGNRIIDFADNNLHVMGYSEPIDAVIDLETLDGHLFCDPDHRDAIPYVTSYYRRTWGFCMSQAQRDTLDQKQYRVKIDSTLAPGSLTYADVVIKGESSDEIMLSTYICHPSMANNEVSGPALATMLIRWLKTQKNKYSYRFVFAPETIGGITYISQNLDTLRNNVKAGFQLSCVGDNRVVTFLSSRDEDTLADRIALHVLNHRAPGFLRRSFLKNRGSDERQYCSPGVDLPFVSIMRSMYAEYPEYHTSLDDMSIISPEGFELSFALHASCMNVLEKNATWKALKLCEPHMSKYGLYPTTGSGKTYPSDMIKLTMDVLMYADGRRDTLSMAELFEQPFEIIDEICETLASHGLLGRVNIE